jgi:hypothetical protein
MEIVYNNWNYLAKDFALGNIKKEQYKNWKEKTLKEMRLLISTWVSLTTSENFFVVYMKSRKMYIGSGKWKNIT